MKLADYIKKYRKENNITQEELAGMLYVTKQAVSKWETERGLPDIETYKELSKLLGVSVDELLGLEKVDANSSNEKKSKKLLILFSIICSILVCAIAIVVIIIATDSKDDKTDNYEKLKQELISKTESELGVVLPEVKEYNYVDFNEWIISGNSYLPFSMYFFVFESEMTIDNLWFDDLSDELINSIPVYLGDYPDTCEYFRIIDLTSGEINIINLNNDKYHSYVLYCIDMDENRLIAISFEV